MGELKIEHPARTEREAPKQAQSAKPDFGSISGLIVAVLAIVGGLTLEGGKIKDIAQITAAIIVLGGTAGAVLFAMPLKSVVGALKRLAGIFLEKTISMDALIDQLIVYAAKARKSGLVSLESDTEQISDPFLKKALLLAVDGTDLQEMRKMLELVIEVEESKSDAEAHVFESAGGYAPTIGIIGAVLGLIQVMKNLANIEEVGHGIAVAFVATVYGVGSANIFFLPAAAKIKARFAAEVHRKELIIEAVSGIIEGMNPKLIRMKVEAYSDGGETVRDKPAVKEKTAKHSKKAAPAEQPAGVKA